jgi:hypothetical protein
MFKRVTNVPPMLAVILGSTALLGQTLPHSSGTSAGTGFPVVMQQKLVAGKTAVGTKIEAKLTAATLVHGVVVPRDAVLSGEVIVSDKKSASAPSRLAIRMDSAEWKKGSAPLKLYLTPWYYPESATTNQDLSYQPQDASNSKRTWNGMGAYPDPNNPISQEKFPAGDKSKNADPANASPASLISKNAVLMKNVQTLRNPEGTIVLVDAHSDLKLDKFTTYVLAAGDAPVN